jgi:HK97 family phage prohead protease
MNNDRNMNDLRQVRSIDTTFQTREDGDELIIEGYFAVFNSNYDIDKGMSESIKPGAFASSMGKDIRALVNHDTTLVLGRTAAHTLELNEDEHGLFGRIRINRKDTDAMNCYERVKRGDVTGCSFGFFPISEETEIRDDGSIHWTITDLDLFEVSACTFPAYQATNISARSKERDDLRRRELDAWKAKMTSRLKGDSTNA